MIIYINTNTECQAEYYEGSAEFGKTDFVEFLGITTIARKVQKLANSIEIYTDSNFSNWNGGKHSRLAQCHGALWCCHSDLPVEIETAIDKIVAEHIKEANATAESIVEGQNNNEQ